jgi:hypothetical protein
MSAVYADTAFYFAPVNRDDALHAAPQAWAISNATV